MTIIRAPRDKDHPFTSMANSVRDSVESSGMTVAGMGLLWLMLTNKDDWRFNQDNLLKRSGLKRTAFTNARKELERAGYLEIKERRVNGHFDNEWIVRDLTGNEVTSNQLPVQSDYTGDDTKLLSQSFMPDIRVFMMDSPFEDMSQQDEQTLLKLAGRLYRNIDKSGSGYEGTEKETSRMMKIALIRAVHKQPNSIGYVVSTVDSWIKKSLLTTDDLERDQQNRTGKTMADVLGLHNSGDDYLYMIDEDEIDWNML